MSKSVEILVATLTTLALCASATGAQQQTPTSEGGAAEPWARPLYLDLPEGSNGPCGAKAPCSLMSFIEGSLGPAQMIRRPGTPWRLWWLADEPMVSGTRVSAMPGFQGGGNMLDWSAPAGPNSLLSRRGLPVLALADGPGHQLHSAGGVRLTDGEGMTLTASEIRPRGASTGHDFRTSPQTLELRSNRDRFRGPIAGGHTLTLDWKVNERRLLVEQRQVRASVLSERDVLIQVDTWLRSTSGSLRFGGERAGLSIPLRVDSGTDPRAFASARQASEPVPAAWAAAASDSGGRDSESTEEEEEPSAHWQTVEFVSSGRPYTAVLLGHPDNPGSERVSWNGGALRSDLSAYVGGGTELRLAYRVWLVDGHDVPRSVITEHADAFAGRSVEPTAEQIEQRKEANTSPWG